MNTRLDRLVSRAAGLSRSEADGALKKGLVTVNGTLCSDGSLKVSENDRVALAGKLLVYEEYVYLVMNKPKGVVCSTRDAGPTVIDLVRKEFPRRKIAPAGRLDKDSTGMVIITDDGEFAHRLISPSSGVMKRYEVIIDSPAGPEVADAFREGVILADGTQLESASLLVGEDPFRVTVCISQGVYHQIKRMFGVYGIGVNELKRVSIGSLRMDENLDEGTYRRLSEEERKLLLTNG